MTDLGRLIRAKDYLGIVNDWRFWVVVLAAGLIAVNVWTLTIFRTQEHTANKQAHDEAIHEAEIVAAADAQYTTCVNSIPVLIKLNGYLDGQRTIANALVANSLANLKTTALSDPLYGVRLKNLKRLEVARQAAQGVRFPVPTKQKCVAIRASTLQKDTAPR